jgi:hypothetical protein
MALAQPWRTAALAALLALLLGARSGSAYEAVAVQRRMPLADPSRRVQSACPHDEGGLLPFEQLVAADVTVPAGKRYLVSEPARVTALTIPAGSELVFADIPGLVLTVDTVTVLGRLRLGSDTCPLLSDGIGITFASGGGLVVDGGVLDLHGKPYAPTWTRLAQTAAARSKTLRLQDPVDWEAGQEVLVVTSAWEDTPDKHENEIRRIASVDSEGTAINLE